jgi:hypothetical protein
MGAACKYQVPERYITYLARKVSKEAQREGVSLDSARETMEEWMYSAAIEQMANPKMSCEDVINMIKDADRNVHK